MKKKKPKRIKMTTRARYTPDGEPSFDGISPKIVRFAGYMFGWHKTSTPCLDCKTPTHYALHRKYSFVPNMEKAEWKREMQNDKNRNFSTRYLWNEYYDKSTRIWCCSEDCFKRITFVHMGQVTMPADVGTEILTKESK